jgi:hypothetical protein
MDFSSANLKSLILNPAESLDVELKPWLDIGRPEHKAKVVKGCLALRNNNGGCLVIGFHDDGRPDSNVPSDVRATYHVDLIQELVARYSFHLFEIKVEFVERDGVEYPIICVPGGMETPVAAKSQLIDDGGKCLIHNDDVYVRSLQANNRVSSTRARAADWERIVRLCFDNREADIGAFIRRHLSGINIENLAGLLRLERQSSAPLDRTIEFLDVGKRRFTSLQNGHGNPNSEAGTREVAAIIEGQVPQWACDEGFLNKLLRTMPCHSGWPPWVDTRNTPDSSLRPYVYEDGWEAYVAAKVFADHLDFWRLEPSGRFYHIRAFEDDLSRPGLAKPQAGETLDFLLQIMRTAEAMSNAMSFARAMGCDETSTSVAFAFRWCGLQGRHLSCWSDPSRMFFDSSSSHQDVVTTKVVVSLEVVESGLSSFVEAAVAPMFAVFGGTHIESSVVENIVHDTFQRRFS